MPDNCLDVTFFVMCGKKDGEAWESSKRGHGIMAHPYINASRMAIVVNQINVRGAWIGSVLVGTTVN